MHRKAWKSYYLEEKEDLLEMFGLGEEQIFRSIQTELKSLEMEK